MTKKLALLGGILILVAALAVPALAGRGGGRDDDQSRGPGWAAGLSEEQVKEFAEARLQFHNETLDLRRQMALKQAELQALMLDPEATDAVVLAKLGQVNDLQAEFSQKRLIHQRAMQKKFPEIGLGQGWGRGGPGQGGGFCAGPDWDSGRDRGRGYCR